MSLLAGWSEKSITPDCPIGLAGQFFERVSEFVETPVTVTALAIESDGAQMTLCSCDLVMVSRELMEDARARLSSLDGFDPSTLILGATHTHTSHVYRKKSNRASNGLSVLSRYVPDSMIYKPLVSSNDAMDPGDAYDFILDRVVEAVTEAWNSRSEAFYAAKFGRAAVGMCRRVCYDDGSAKMWGDSDSPNFTALEGGNDNGIELIYFYGGDRKLKGILANIACPSQVVEHRSYVSADYWGKVKILLRREFGENLFLIPFCAAAGDQAPRDLIRWVEPESHIDDPNILRVNYKERHADPSMFDVKGTWTVGRRIASEISAISSEIEETELKSEALLSHEKLTLDLPIRRVTIAEYNNALAVIKRYVEDNKGKTFNFEDNAMLHVYAGTLGRFEQQKDTDCFSIEVHFARLGDIAFATNPFELFLDYGNQIRARSPAKQTVLIQLSCGTGGYLPTEKAEAGGHYSAYVSSGMTGHEGGNLLVRRTITELRKLWKTK